MSERAITVQDEAARDCLICLRKCNNDQTALPIFNKRTRTWHAENEYGVTQCGKDATRDHWLWPL